MLFKFRSDIKLYKFEDLGIVLDETKETCYILNQTATWLLSMMSEFVTLEDLSTLAKQKYQTETKDNIFFEIQEIMRYLSERNIIEVKFCGD
ncbi:hypothetical protein PCC7424_4544 [Gloeothece citriformis PCC 7424]|uniref:Coenzyme PQQ synthesis D n=2 Tax=Gloeothece TaxID=28070 RepID=B7KAD3_GLOC7|nr:hypothetical protein PCC7424_4544 [Gloeothece citriformis PCC 7424]